MIPAVLSTDCETDSLICDFVIGVMYTVKIPRRVELLGNQWGRKFITNTKRNRIILKHDMQMK